MYFNVLIPVALYAFNYIFYSYACHLHSYFLATFSLLFLLSIVCMYIFLALLLYLHM